MAKLPTVDDKSLSTPQPARGIATYNPAQVSNADANFLIQGGNQLAQLGAEFDRIAEEESHRFDTLRAEQAYNDLKAKQLDLTLGDNGFTKLKGQSALAQGQTKQWVEQFEQSRRQIESGLSNDRQKNLFKSRADATALQYQEDIMRHLATEQDTYAQSVYASTIDVEIGNASARWDEPAVVAQSHLRINNAIDQEAARNHWSAEEKEAVRIDTLSQFHKTVIDNALARGDVEYAGGWLEANEKEINAATVAQVNNAMEQAKKANEEQYLRSESQRLADEITGKIPDYAAQVAAAEKVKNPELRDRLLTRIDQNQTRENRIKTQQNEALQEMIIDHVITRKGTTDDIDPASWLKLPATERAFLEKYVEDRDTGNDMTTLQKLEFYDAVSTSYAEDPASIRDWTVAELAARVPKDKLNDVLGWRQKAATPDQPIKLDATDGQKNKIIENAIQQVKADKDDTKRALVRDRIEEDILTFKQVNQKEPTYTDLEEIRDRLIQEITFDREWWPVHESKYRYQLTGEEDLSQIVVPDADKERILKRIQDKYPGMAVTDDQLRQIYQREQF